jgi:outer membrane protein TolC
MRFWFFIPAIFLLTGCVHYQPQPVSPDAFAARWDQRRLDDPGLKKFIEQNNGHSLTNWPPARWDFDSLTLVAFYFHPGLEVAHAQWLVAVAGEKTAGARPNPTVSVNPAYDSQIPGNYSPWMAPLSFDIPLETDGKRRKRIAEAQAAAESARWNFIAAVWQIRSNVRASLQDLNAAENRTKLLASQFALQKKIMGLLQSRLDAGEISRPDLVTAQLALNQTQLDLGDAQSAKVAAQSRLAQALGLGESALIGQKFKFEFPPRGFNELTARQARQLALRSRADILAALADYATAEADLRLEVARQYPDLHLGPGYAWNNGNYGDNQWSLGATLELPILDQNQGPIAEAQARRKLAAAKFIELQSQVIGQIDLALDQVRAARQQLKNGNDLLAIEQQQEKSEQAQLAAGAADPLDLLTAQLTTANARLTQLDNEAKWQAAVGSLEDALQQPTDSLTAAINNLSGQDPDERNSHP